eukprot:gene375-684_t
MLMVLYFVHGDYFSSDNAYELRDKNRILRNAITPIRNLDKLDCDENDPRTALRTDCFSNSDSSSIDQPSSTDEIEMTPTPTKSTTRIPARTDNSGKSQSTTFDFSDDARCLLKASDGEEYDHYGFSLALNKDIAVIGAYDYKNAGAVYIYTPEHPEENEQSTQWIQKQKISPSDLKEDDDFGFTISINERILYIGAYRTDKNKEITNSGVVYIYVENDNKEFIQNHKLQSFKPSSDEYFGYAIATSGRFTIISAYGNSDKGNNAGIVYVFIQENPSGLYGNNAKIYPSDAKPNQLFGSELSMYGNKVLIGAVGDNSRGVASGSAYIYEYNEGANDWGSEIKIITDDSDDYDYFGCTLALQEDFAFIGAYLSDGYTSSSGAVYIFKRIASSTSSLSSTSSNNNNNNNVNNNKDNNDNNDNNNVVKDIWYQFQKLSPADGHPNQYYGHSLSYSNKVILIGAPGDGTIVSSSGSAYVYQQTTSGQWELMKTLVGNSGGSSGGSGNSKIDHDNFGCSVTLFENTALIGAETGNGVSIETAIRNRSLHHSTTILSKIARHGIPNHSRHDMSTNGGNYDDDDDGNAIDISTVQINPATGMMLHTNSSYHSNSNNSNNNNTTTGNNRRSVARIVPTSNIPSQSQAQTHGLNIPGNRTRNNMNNINMNSSNHSVLSTSGHSSSNINSNHGNSNSGLYPPQQLPNYMQTQTHQYQQQQHPSKISKNSTATAATTSQYIQSTYPSQSMSPSSLAMSMLLPPLHPQSQIQSPSSHGMTSRAGDRDRGNRGGSVSIGGDNNNNNNNNRGNRGNSSGSSNSVFASGGGNGNSGEYNDVMDGSNMSLSALSWSPTIDESTGSYNSHIHGNINGSTHRSSGVRSPYNNFV